MEKQYLLVYLLYFSILLTSYQVHGIFSSLGLYNPLKCFSNNISYSDFEVDFYFSSRNQYHYKLTDKDIVSGYLDFNPKRRTVVSIHGLLPQVYESRIALLRDSFLQWGDINLIEVDWRRGCSHAVTYVKAVVNTENAAIKISKLFGNLIRAWHRTERSVENWSYLHVIGHSLGAHVAGQAAARLRRDHNLLVDRVTGLDPAGMCFHTVTHLNLKKSDAVFVDTVHTDGGLESQFRLGQSEPVGHIDFYVNGGTIQPGCRTLRLKRETINLPRLGYQLINENGICQHLRAYDLFADSLKQVGKRECIFWAHPWRARDIQTGQPPIELEFCDEKTCIEMGINAEYYQNKRGIYYAPTSGASPFCNY